MTDRLPCSQAPGGVRSVACQLPVSTDDTQQEATRLVEWWSAQRQLLARDHMIYCTYVNL